MVQYYVHEKLILDAAKAYQIIFDTIKNASEELQPTLNKNGTLLNTSFQNFVIYLLISPYDNEKVDMLNIIQKNYARELENNDLLSRFVSKLLTYELMPLNEQEIEQ